MGRNVDELIHKAIFSTDSQEKTEARHSIRTIAKEEKIISSSLFPLYQAIGNGQVASLFTVPAINIRTLTYDTARLIFRLMKRHHIGPVIFEIAKSEMGYTGQRPDEYCCSILAAAIKEDYKGPVFIQGDHFQLNKEQFEADREKELSDMKRLIKEAIQAEFLNIDIDASTLVDLTKDQVVDQQTDNSEVTALLTECIRKNQPTKTSVAIGGEIGHIGGKNSTTEDFEAFMDRYLSLISHPGISKVSVQTGSSHGGIPLPDGTIQQVTIDFSVLENIGHIAREKYHLAGAVQHGASTLPLESFNQFPQKNTVEIHLATGFQNIVYNTMPKNLREEMYSYVKEHFQDERTDEMTEEQFIYKTRKKALGPFKEKLWNLSESAKQPILSLLEKQFETIFEKLGVYNTREIIEKYYRQNG